MSPQLTLTPKGLALGGVVLVKRASDGALAIDEERLRTLLTAAYGREVTPRMMNGIRCAGELLRRVPEQAWDDRTPHRGNDVPVLAKVKMLLALTGLNGASAAGVTRMQKAEAFMNKGASPQLLLKLLKEIDDDSDDGDDDSEDDDNSEEDSDESDGNDSSDFNAEHPRWPASSPGGIGGEFAPKDEESNQGTQGEPQATTTSNGAKPYLVADITSDLENLGGGTPAFVPTPKGASQFIFPNGTILRFDLYPGQYLGGQGPHINLETGGANIHIPVGR